MGGMGVLLQLAATLLLAQPLVFGQLTSKPGGSTSLAASVAAIAAAVPPLFDFSDLPTAADVCANCKGKKEVYSWCCGVCQFYTKRCSDTRPGEDIPGRVLETLARLGVDMNRLKNLNPLELFSRIKGRTLWFIGDSETWSMFQAAECFLRGYAAAGLQRTYVNDNPAVQASFRITYRVNKTSVPACLELQHSTRLCAQYVTTAYDIVDIVLPALIKWIKPRYLRKDLLVYNFGLHIYPAQETYFTQVQYMMDYHAAHKADLPTMIWADTAPTHFNSPQGMLVTTGVGKTAGKPCAPLQLLDLTMQLGGPYNQFTYHPALEGKLGYWLRTFNLTYPLWFAHKNSLRDCVHYCQPGAPQVWVYLLDMLMNDRRLGNYCTKSTRGKLFCIS